MKPTAASLPPFLIVLNVRYKKAKKPGIVSPSRPAGYFLQDTG